MNKIIASMVTAAIMTAAAVSYSDSVQSELCDNLLRLHIIADSDSAEDQAVKLMVRDAVINEIGDKFKNSDIEICRENVENSLSDIEAIADRVLEENGFTYTAHAAYGKYSFPEKSYSSVTLPAGDYYGVRVTLGSGGGKNWWCVMYPPMCFTENAGGEMSDESRQKLHENLTDDTYDVITAGSDGAKVKFRIVEFFQEVKQSIGW